MHVLDIEKVKVSFFSFWPDFFDSRRSFVLADAGGDIFPLFNTESFSGKVYFTATDGGEILRLMRRM